MQPTELLKTIYLGDRACKALSIESWRQQVILQVNVISRVRSSSGRWEFYTDEDIPDGRLVFTGVASLELNPSGPLPNDFINDIRVTDVEDLSGGKKMFCFRISVSSVDAEAVSTEVIIEIRAENLHLEDPARPGEAIRT